VKNRFTILFLFLFAHTAKVGAQATADRAISFDFCGDKIAFAPAPGFSVPFGASLSQSSIEDFYQTLLASPYQSIIDSLQAYKERYRPDDWLYYQLIRKTAEQYSPKAENYIRYTLYKWFLLTQSGYDALLTISNQRLLFYVRSDETIYNIPTHIKDNKQYICLNFHDYPNLDVEKERFKPVVLPTALAQMAFSYKVTRLPEFRPADYQEKDIHFNYYDNEYRFKVKVNKEVQAIFNNYPAGDYASHFNIPLSKETYNSLIPQLKKNIRGLSEKNGVDYLMRFTRYAFLYEKDTDHFGKEKRLSPEQTLLYDGSDCEDRVGLFFYLVKEIYDLPMIVMAYPSHVSIAVQLKKPSGKPVFYDGASYYVCEPTPQKEDLAMGEILPSLKTTPFEVVYAYRPHQK
jgi:hypothetical protein